MKQIGQFTIEGRLPSINEVIANDRGNYYHSNAAKQNAEALILMYINNAIRRGDMEKQYDEPVLLYIDWYEPNNRRDSDNIKAGGQKLILDAMRKAGVIKNDGPRYVRDVIGWVHYPMYDNPKKLSKIQVTIMGLEAEVTT